MSDVLGHIVVHVERGGFAAEKPNHVPLNLTIIVDGGLTPKNGFKEAVENLVEHFIEAPPKDSA